MKNRRGGNLTKKQTLIIGSSKGGLVLSFLLSPLAEAQYSCWAHLQKLGIAVTRVVELYRSFFLDLFAQSITFCQKSEFDMVLHKMENMNWWCVGHLTSKVKVMVCSKKGTVQQVSVFPWLVDVIMNCSIKG